MGTTTPGGAPREAGALTADLTAFMQQVGQMIGHCKPGEPQEAEHVFTREGVGLPEVFHALHDMVGSEIQPAELLYKFDPDTTFVVIVSKTHDGQAVVKIKLSGDATVRGLRQTTVYMFPAKYVVRQEEGDGVGSLVEGTRERITCS